MNKQGLFRFFAIGIMILSVGLACSLFGPQTPATQAPQNPGPTSQSNNNGSVNSGSGISNLTDVQNAVIQIESDGTFVDPQVGLVVNGAGRGSGFIIDPSGIAVTNNHVVTGAALLKVWVGGVQHNARILGVSECSDLAVIKVEGGPYSYLNWYNGQVKTGLEVYAAGYPLGEPQFSLTKGIISKEKADGQTSWASLDYTLGHDATINPGNSGGPLLTGDGQVVGINYASLSSANQYFAIDAKTAEPVIEQLKKEQDVDSIGINGTAVQSSDGKLTGIWVSSVKSGSPADKAGIKGGDILYQMENLVLATDGTMKDYCSILRTHKPSDTLSISVIRYASGEVLEGQLNGRELAVTGNFNNGGASSGGATQPPSSGSTTVFTDQNNYYQIDVPSDWKYSQTVDNTNNYYYIDQFKSPDGNALVENIVYDDGTAFTGSDKSKFSLYLLNTFYSNTGKEGDIRVSDDSIQKDGSERLTWTSKSGGYSGISFLETRGTTTFLMFTVEWANSARDQYLDTLNAVVASYRLP